MGGFRTHSELDSAFTSLRLDSHIPQAYVKFFDDKRGGTSASDESRKGAKAREVIEWLTREDPKERPSTTSLIQR